MAPLNPSTLSSIPTSFATVSIGYSVSHTLPLKLHALSSAGFKGIELGFPDLVSFASQHLNKSVAEKDFDDLVTAAEEVKKICQKEGLEIMLLQPFANYEGWKEGSDEQKEAWERVEGWLRVLNATGCETLQVGSTDTPLSKLTPSLRPQIIADLRKLADHLAPHSKRIAYENWCWSSHAPDWSDVWSICQAVDRPNFGLCLDTFQTGGGEWGDPTSSTGILADKSQEEVDRSFAASMAKLGKTVPAEKIYLLQISDAYKLKTPITQADEDGLRPRGRWSHDFRPVPFQGGYLPVVDVARAVLKTGFRGWFSYEVFDSGPDGEGKEYDLDEYAKVAYQCQERLMKECAEEK